MNRKKIAAGFISFALMMQSCVFAVSAAEENKTANFEYDDFSVSYSVTNSYGNTEVVSLTLTNTGNETIEDWMLYFEPNGDIQYVTNATEMTAENGKMYFKNNGYNADIAPSSAVTFTYAVNDCTEIPDYYALCQTRVEKTEGYDVSLSVGESLGDSFNGSIVITNHTDKPIEAWELSIDTNFTITEISNSWAATVTELDEYQYLLKGTYTSTIAANSSVSLGFIGVKSGEPEISSYSLTEMKENLVLNEESDEINLRASTKKLSNEDDNQVTFYAETLLEVDEINLVSLDTNTVVGVLKDDGDLYNSGDEYMNDGVYTGTIHVDTSKVGKNNYIAVYKDIQSNTTSVAIYKLFTQQELNDMETVNTTISSLLNSSEYIQSDISERVEKVKVLLNSLSELDETLGYSLIQKDTIKYYNDSNIYEFKYACGVNYVLDLNNDDSVDENILDESVEVGDSLTVNSNSDGICGTALIMDGFEDEDYRNNYYNKLKENLDSLGLATTLKMNVTISDLEKMENYDFISISMHGSGESEGHVYLQTQELSTLEKNQKYAYELSQGIVAAGYKYYINEDFFREYYNENSFDGSIMYLQSCCGLGSGSSFDQINYAMTDALQECGADAVIGNFNSVFSDYNQNVMKLFIENLIHGYTTDGALINCKDTYGYDDGDGDGILDCVGIKRDAVPILVGDTNKYLVNQNIKNGSFESNLSEWQQNGNVNTKLKLGSITPESGKRMAFITTRTNESAESSVAQSFKVPSYASTISFTYDVISDEPMEWVNEGYNDTFNAYLVTSDGTISLATESTDTSNWVRITDVNLPDGDNTTYHTGKIKVTYNISALRGKNVKLVFVVKDSGDNTYDTAAVVDNVTLTK